MIWNTKKTQNEYFVISEGNSIAIFILCCLPAVIIFSFIYLNNGISFSKGRFSDAFGIWVYPFFYGGLFYAEYEFLTMLLNRRRFIVRDGEYIKALNHFNIHIDTLRKVEITKRIGIKSLTITDINNNRFNIRSYLIKKSLHEVKNIIDEMRKSEFRFRCA